MTHNAGRREGKSKEERERYIQMNAEFQRAARRDEQCKEAEETLEWEKL